MPERFLKVFFGKQQVFHETINDDDVVSVSTDGNIVAVQVQPMPEAAPAAAEGAPAKRRSTKK